jgi:hypothetical protein
MSPYSPERASTTHFSLILAQYDGFRGKTQRLNHTPSKPLEGITMKSLIKVVAVAAALALPVACFAQTAPQSAQQPADNGEYVQIIQLEEIDAVPAAAQNQPAAATAPAHDAAQPASTDSYGGVASGSSKSGAPAFNPANDIGLNSIYQHH